MGVKTRGDTIAAKLKEYDTVLGASGSMLTVVFKKIHGRTKRPLVTLRTAQAELTVTADHRVVVAGPHVHGVPREDVAGNLTKDDLVYCGARFQKLTRVMPFEANIEVVEIGFDPDDAIEAFPAPRWGILTKGRRSSFRISAYSQLGPFSVEASDQNGSHHARQRSQSV